MRDAVEEQHETLSEAFVGWIETHDVEQIRRVLEAGLDPRATIRGRSTIEWMIEMYTRSPRFPACVQLLLDAGAECNDPGLQAVLLDDAEAVARLIESDDGQLDRRLSLVTTYALLSDATLLHVAAEFGNANAARTLIEAGAHVEAEAAVDEHGIGGQTPLFHTVNTNFNHCAPVMRLLLDAGARTDVRLRGLRWGKGFPWETTLYDVTPISYAQAGLFPQFHRKAKDIYDNIEAMLEASNRPVPPRVNVPNAYVMGKTTP